MQISIPERGSSLIPKDVWERLSSDTLFWRLVDDKVTSVAVLKNGAVRLAGSCYVGRAIISDVTVDFVEKIPGAFAALAGAAAPSTFKVFHVPSPVSPIDATTGLLVKIFIEAAHRYASSSKEVRYVQRRSRGALIGGALDVIETIRLRSRGVRNQVAFRKTELTGDTPLNRVVFAALRRVERLKTMAACDLTDVVRARSLSLVLSDGAVEASSLATSLPALAIEIAEDRGRRSEITELAELAGAILADAGFGGDSLSNRTVVRSWFVNLEKLFERAVRRAMREALAGKATVEGATQGVKIFTDGAATTSRYPANTDIVIRSQDGSITIGDAKYKDRPSMSWPDAAEVHEVLTHASAYDAKRAFIVYPAESYWTRRIGLSKAGCELWAVGLRLATLAADSRLAVASMGIASSSSTT